MRRTRLNVRLLAILVGIAAVVGMGLFFLHRSQVRRQVDSSLSRARQLVEKAESIEVPEQRYASSEQAWRAYRQYLVSRPEDVDVLVEEAFFLRNQGKWFAENGDRADAIKLNGLSCYFFEQALRQAEDRRDVRREFVEVLFEFGDYKTTIQHIRFLCDPPKDEDSLEKLFDRYDLWSRANVSGRRGVGEENRRDLSQFLDLDKKTVQRDRLLEFLQGDLWMVLEDPDLLNILGRSYLGLNNPESAIQSLKKAVTLRSDNLDAYDALVKVLRSREHSEEAEYWSSEVVEANPDLFRSYLIRGQDYLSRKDIAKSQDAAEAFLAKAEWDALRATQKAAQRIAEEADRIIPDAEVAANLKKDFNSAINRAPAPGQAVSIAYRDALLKVVTDVGPAVELMKKTFSEKESPKAEKGSASDTNSLFESLIEKDLTGCRDGLLLAINCEMQRSSFDKENSEKHIEVARRFAQSVLSLFPEDAQVYMTLADIEFQAGNIKQMIHWLIRGTQNAKENAALSWRLGVAHAVSGKMDEADKILQQLIAGNKNKIFIDHLQAILYMQEENWSSAAETFEKVRPEFVILPSEVRKIDILLARCYEKLGRLDEQREAFSRAASLDRSWGPALLGLARSRAASGKLEEAVKDYESMLRLPDVTPEIYLEYAQVLLRNMMEKPKAEQNFKLVEDAMKQASAAMSGSPRILILQADFFIAKGEVENARRLLTTWLKQLNEAKEKVLQQRKVLLKEAESLTGTQRDAKLKEAKKLLAAVQTLDAQKPLVWEKLILLASHQGDWEAAAETLQKAESKLGDTPAIRLLRAQKLFRQADKDSAMALHALAENTDSFNRVQKLDLFRRLAIMAISLNDLPQAEKLAKKVCDLEPRDIDMQKVLFHVAASNKDLAAMQAILDRIRKFEAKTSAFWYYGEAMRLYVLSKKSNDPKLIESAINLLQKASRMDSLWSSPAFLLAQIYREQGKIVEATNSYIEAIQNGIQDPAIIQDVARLLTQQRRYQEADQMFDRLTQLRDGDLQGVNNLSASYVKAQLGDFTQAISMARKVCENSNNYKDFLWLGRVLGVSAKRASEEHRDAQSEQLYHEAEKVFLKALELNRSATATWIGLVQLYGWFDKKEKANETLEQAKTAIPEGEVDLALAQAYETLGEVKKARIYYRKVIRNMPDNVYIARIAAIFFLKNGFFDESKMLLKRIVDKQIDASEPQTAWAKRTLGVLMVHENSVGDITETIKLIDENLKNNPTSILDLYTKASILADDPTGLYNDEAIATFEKIRSLVSDPGVSVLQRLADLYHDTGRWNDFKVAMQVVLSKMGDNPQIVGRYVIRLFKHGEYSEAEVWLEKLKKIAPDDINTLGIECNFDFERKRYDELLRIINAWVENPNQKTDPNQRLNIAASLYQRYALDLRDQNEKVVAQKFEKRAEDSMLRYVEANPKAELNLAVLYAQQNKFDKVMPVLRKVVDGNNLPQITATVYRVLTEGSLSREQVIQIRDILKPVQDANSSAFLAMMLALCEEQLGESQQAESILRDALQKEPNNVDLMNYLAVSLALNKKKLDEARNLIEKVIRTAGPLPDLLDSRAIVALAQNRPKEALNDLRRAITLKPSASFYFHLAEVLNQEGLKKPAVKALEKAQKLGLRENTLLPVEQRNYRRLKLSLQ